MRLRPLILGLGCVLVVVSWLIAAPASATLPTLAQAASSPTPAAPVVESLIAPYPPGVSLTALAVQQVTAPAANPASLRIERWSLGPSDTLAGPNPALRLVAVENGTLRLTRFDGAETRYGTGSSVLIAAGEDVTLASDDATPVVWVQGTLGADETAPAGDGPTNLLAGDARLPRGDVTVALIRFTVASGTSSGPRVFTGPVGFAIESGTLTIAELSGPPTQIERGGGLVAPAFTQHELSNGGPTPVAGVAFAVFPNSPALAGAPAATATPAVDVAATATVAALIDANATSEAAAIDAANQAASAVSEANATVAAVESRSLGFSTDLGTMTARAFTAEATAASLAPGAATAEAALASSLDAEAAAVGTAIAYATAAANAAADHANVSASATVTANEVAVAQTSAGNAAATLTVQTIQLDESVAASTAAAATASAREGTMTADLAAATGNQANLAAAEATRSAELAAAQLVIGTQAAQLTAVAAATSPAIDANFRSVRISSDVRGLLNGDAATADLVVTSIREQLAAEIRNDCRAGLVLTFGYAESPDVTGGVTLAGAINDLVVAEIPELFGSAVTEQFAQLEEPYGTAELGVYLTTECTAPVNAVVVSTPSPAQPTIQPSQ